MSIAKLFLNGQEYEIPIVTGSEGEVGIDIASLRTQSGAITLDPGYGNTGSCESAITFIDGEKGILRHRGYSIEELARLSNFVEVSFLLIYGHLPNAQELADFQHESPGRVTGSTSAEKKISAAEHNRFFNTFDDQATARRRLGMTEDQ